MKIRCKEFIETKVKKNMTIYECKLKNKIYYHKKKVCKDCPSQLKLNFQN